MIDSIIENHEEDFKKALDHYKFDLGSLRTGRANPALLQTVQVDSYGSKVPLEHVASISVSDAKTLTISPWDKSQITAIEKGIQVANLGFNPSNDGNIVRITLPLLSEERRKEMVKLLGQLAEKAKIGIRNVREDIMKEMKKAESEGKVSKDDLVYGQKKIQEKVDSLNSEIKEYAGSKEKEIMTV